MSNFQERKTIRESWASEQANLPQTKVIFLLGTIGNSENGFYKANVHQF